MIICEYCKKENCLGICDNRTYSVISSGIAKAITDGVKQDVHSSLFGTKDASPNKIFSWWNPLWKRKEKS